MNHVDHLVDDYLHDLLSGPEARRVADHCATCDACRQALDRARRRLAAIRSVPPTEATPELVAATMDRVEDAPRVPTRSWGRRIGTTVAMIAACAVVLLGTQFYYSSLRANPVELLVLGQNNLLPEAQTSYRVRLFDRQARTPLAQVPVTFELVEPGGDVRPLAEVTTDASGVGQPSFTVPDVDDGDYRLRVTARTTGKPEVIERQVRVRRSWQVMLSTDKPIYQPGQTIHLRALSLRRPMLVPVADQPAVFTLTDPKGNILFKESMRTSSFGLAAVDCPLAGEVPEGTYTLACKIGDSESRQPIPIQKYVLPKFAIDLAFDRPFYTPGDDIICSVKATYTTGKPVVRGVVVLESQAGQARGTTDEQGKVTLRVRPPFQGGNEMNFPMSCKVVDPAGQSNERQAQRLVTTRPYRIDLLPENGSLVAGVENTVHIVATKADGTPAQVHVTVNGLLEELTTNAEGIASFKLTPTGGMTLRYQATDDNGRVLDVGERTFNAGQGDNDFLIRSDRAVYQGGQTMKLTVHGTGDEPVQVDLLREGNERYTLRSETIPLTNGKGQLEIDLNPDLVGTMSLLAYRFGVNGLAVQKTRLIQVLPAGELQIQATLDQEEYRPAGEAKFKFKLVDAEGKPRVGALSLAGVDEAVYALLPLKPGSEKTFFAVEPKVIEAVTARYPWTPVSVETPAQVAREQAIFSVTARRAEVGNVAPQPMPDRGMRMGDEEIDEPTIRPVQPSASLGLLSLEATSFQEKVRQVTQLQKSAMNWIYRGWLMLGLIGAGLAYASLWIFLPRREAIALHAGIALLGVPLALVVLSQMVGMERGEVFMSVGNVIGGRDMTPKSAAMAREDRPLLLDESQSMTGPAAPRVREHFPETLLWRPELVTNEQGEATLTVPLADSITTWRISASAVDTQGRLGARQMPLKVFQPFFVDFNLPISLTRNDQVGIPVVVSSYLDKPQTVTLKLKKDDWYDLIDGEVEQKVTIQPGEVKAVTYRIAVRKVGSRQLEVAALAGEVSDAIRRSIEVVPDGRPVDLTASGSLEAPYTTGINLPENAIEGSGRLYVKIYPSRFSQVVEGLDNIFRMPYGCFEQTSSTTYPNVLALDYLQQTRQDRPEVAAKARHYIRLGYQRLVGFEVSGGGFDWFGRPPANLTLTAYGLMEFEDMARVAEVDPALIERTRTWILNKRAGDGSWSPDLHGLHENITGGMATLNTTSYIAWAVFASGRASELVGATKDYLLSHRPDQIPSPHTLALVANALLAIDPTGSSALPYLEKLESLVTEAGPELAYWQLPQNAETTFYGRGQAGNIETTALATLALIQAKKAPETTRRALGWLVSQKDRHGTWHSTQATVLSLRALLAAAAGTNEEPKERRILVKLGEHRQEIIVPKEKAEVMQMVNLSEHLKAGRQPLEVSEPTKTGVGYQVTYRYHLPGAIENLDAPLNLAVEYAQKEVVLGETVSAVARIKNGAERAAAMLLVELPIPAGFQVRSEDFASLVKQGSIARYQVEGGRVLVYLREMPRNARLELPYTLEARQVVDTQTQAARLYEYYDPSREAFSLVSRLRVTER